MKKILIWTLAAMGLMMSASCSEENIAPETVPGLVTITASVPELSTKTVPEAPEGHKLRCILVVDYPEAADARFEQIAEGTNNFSFTFTPQEAGYTCLFWADYIASDASGSGGKYADKYYNTADLHSIGYVQAVLSDGSLFNNEACDAFSGTLSEGKTAVTLYRPFAKLTFKDREGDAITASAITVKYAAVPSGFDVLTNTASETVSISETVAAPANAAEGVWFYNYIFAPVDGQALPGDITLTVDEGEAKTIPATQIPLDANHDTGLTFTVGEATTITVDVEDGMGVERPVDPKVGDFFYSDATYSTTLDDTKTVVGVVFAVADANGAASADVVANYSETSLSEIRGWVVGLKEITPTPRFANAADGSAGVNIEGIEDVNTDEADIKGYANTSAWKGNLLSASASYAALNAVDSYAATYNATVTGTATGWYLPAIGQLDVLRTAYNAENSAVKTALESLSGTADLFATGTGGSSYYWSSTAKAGDGSNSVRTIVFDSSVEKYIADHAGNAGRHCRPVLTF